MKIHTGIISQTYHYTEIKVYTYATATRQNGLASLQFALNSQCFRNLFKTVTVNDIQSKPNTKIQTNIDDKRYHPSPKKVKTKQNTIIKTTTDKIQLAVLVCIWCIFISRSEYAFISIF